MLFSKSVFFIEHSQLWAAW